MQNNKDAALIKFIDEKCLEIKTQAEFEFEDIIKTVITTTPFTALIKELQGPIQEIMKECFIRGAEYGFLKSLENVINKK